MRQADLSALKRKEGAQMTFLESYANLQLGGEGFFIWQGAFSGSTTLLPGARAWVFAPVGSGKNFPGL